MGDSVEFSILYLYAALIIIAAALNLVLWRNTLSREKALETVLFWCLFIGVGITGLTGFFLLVMFPGASMNPSGWSPRGALPFETGTVWLALGLAGLACTKWRKGFWGATILISSVVLLGDVMRQALATSGKGIEGIGMSGPVFWYEVVLMVVLVVLWIWIWSDRRKHDVWMEPPKGKRPETIGR